MSSNVKVHAPAPSPEIETQQASFCGSHATACSASCLFLIEVSTKDDPQIFPKFSECCIGEMQADIKFASTLGCRNYSVPPESQMSEGVSLVVFTIIELHSDLTPELKIHIDQQIGRCSVRFLYT